MDYELNMKDRVLAEIRSDIMIKIQTKDFQQFVSFLKSYNYPSLPKQMSIHNASLCTRLLTPSFSLYRFVVSRT